MALLERAFLTSGTSIYSGSTPPRHEMLRTYSGEGPAFLTFWELLIGYGVKQDSGPQIHLVLIQGGSSLVLIRHDREMCPATVHLLARVQQWMKAAACTPSQEQLVGHCVNEAGCCMR